MYQDAQGVRVTVYLRKPEAGHADAAFRYEQQGELGLFYWIEAGAGYALVGAAAQGHPAGAGRRPSTSSTPTRHPEPGFGVCSHDGKGP